MPDLFLTQNSPPQPSVPPADAPLAERMRPACLEEYSGQDHILAPGKLLRRAIEAGRAAMLAALPALKAALVSAR